jgi:uncharacterized protein (DUF58 family)
MTGKGILLFVLILTLFFLGLASLNGGIIALAIPLLVFIGLALLQRPEELSLRASRTISPDRVSVGEPVIVRLSVTNDGLPVHELRLADIVVPGLEVIEGETRMLTPLATGETVELEYAVRGTRGAYRFQQVHIAAVESFGLFQRQALLPAAGYLIVQPAAQKLRAIAIRPPRTRGFAGPIPSRQGGTGVDFFGVREYQMGDRLRSVNWRVTARRVTASNDERIFSNVFEQERIADVGLILDARQQSEIRTHPSSFDSTQDGSGGSLFEHSIQAAASLAETFLNDGNRVGLLVYGSGIDGVFPGYGRVQKDRILRALGRAAAGHHFVFEKLDRLPTRFFPAQSQIVFIGPIANDDAPTLMRLRALGYAVMVVSPNPVAFEMQTLGSNHSSDRVQYASRVAAAERMFNLQRLKRAGIQVVDWDVDQPLDAVIRTSLARQPAQSRSLVKVL